MRLLDLFCGAGGAAVGYWRAGFKDIVGVDIKRQSHYLFKFVRADALEFPLEGFDLIHASPPCQLWTAYGRRGGNVGEGYVDLLTPIRERLRESGAPYIIENVSGAPLENPVRLCGSYFGLDVRRHRFFESNLPLQGSPCRHSLQKRRFPQASNRSTLRRTVEVGSWRIPLPIQKKAMGIYWMNKPELSEAIPPAYTKYLGEQVYALWSQ